MLFILDQQRRLCPSHDLQSRRPFHNMPFPNIFIPKYILIADATFMHDVLPLTIAGRVPTEQIPGWHFASSIHDWPSGRLLGVLRALQALQRIQAHRYATNSIATV